MCPAFCDSARVTVIQERDTVHDEQITYYSVVLEAKYAYILLI